MNIVPDRCESPIRGHFDKIYESGGWQLKTRRPSDFYNDAAWPHKDIQRISASGPGSDLGNTETSLKIIKETIAKFDVTSMIDGPGCCKLRDDTRHSILVFTLSVM